MKATTTKNFPTGKILSIVIVALVAAGTFFLPMVAGMDKGSSIMTKLFLGFFGAIIAIQIVPGLMLFGVIVKGLFNLGHKNTELEARKTK